MTPKPEGHPASPGYILESIQAIRQSFSLEPPTGKEGAPQILFQWNWRIVDEAPDDSRLFEVLFGVEVVPTEDYPAAMEVTLLGRFRISGDVNVDFPLFVRQNGPAIMLPYVRQILTDLSLRSSLRPFYLPIINVAVISADWTFAESTGIEQIGRNPKLLQRLGLEEFVEEKKPTLTVKREGDSWLVVQEGQTEYHGKNRLEALAAGRRIAKERGGAVILERDD